MGARGTKPKPAALLKLAGSKKLKYNPRGEVILPEAKTPEMPKSLDTAGRACWRRLTVEFAKLDLLASIDLDALSRYCDLHSLYKKTRKALNDGAPIVVKRKDAQGRIISERDRPEIGRLIKLSERLDRLEAKFGMTPSDRALLKKATVSEKPTGKKQGKARYFA